MRKVYNKLKEFDKFGEAAGFTIRGSGTYGTGLGLLLTLLIYAVSLIYAKRNYEKLVERADTAHQQVVEENTVAL